MKNIVWVENIWLYGYIIIKYKNMNKFCGATEIDR